MILLYIWGAWVLVGMLVFLFIGVPLTMATGDEKYEEVTGIFTIAGVFAMVTVPFGLLFGLQWAISKFIKWAIDNTQ